MLQTERLDRMHLYQLISDRMPFYFENSRISNPSLALQILTQFKASSAYVLRLPDSGDSEPNDTFSPDIPNNLRCGSETRSDTDPHHDSVKVSVVTLAGGKVWRSLPRVGAPSCAAAALTALGWSKSLWSWMSCEARTWPSTDEMAEPRTAISVVTGLVRCGLTTDSVSCFPDMDAEPLRPARVLTGGSAPI